MSATPRAAGASPRTWAATTTASSGPTSPTAAGRRTPDAEPVRPAEPVEPAEPEAAAPSQGPAWTATPRRPGAVSEVFAYQGDLVGAQGWAVQHGWTISDG